MLCSAYSTQFRGYFHDWLSIWSHLLEFIFDWVDENTPNIHWFSDSSHPLSATLVTRVRVIFKSLCYFNSENELESFQMSLSHFTFWKKFLESWLITTLQLCIYTRMLKDRSYNWFIVYLFSSLSSQIKPQHRWRCLVSDQHPARDQRQLWVPGGQLHQHDGHHGAIHTGPLGLRLRPWVCPEIPAGVHAAGPGVAVAAVSGSTFRIGNLIFCFKYSVWGKRRIFAI